MNQIKKYLSENWITIAFSLLIFGWVLYVSKSTTLAGDDWAFHNNVMNDGIIDSAIGMYYGWEGRLMTLFSIHTLIIHKPLWEILNASFYMIIYLTMILMIKPTKKFLVSILFVFLVLTMKDNIRMEVMTWITGSVYYGIPLMLSFVYLGLNFKLFEDGNDSPSLNIYLVSLGCAFYLPLGMENIAIASMVGTFVLLLANYIRDKRINLLLILNIAIMIISYIIWFNSPGSSIRLDRMPEWQALGFFGKLTQTLPNVLYYTFYQNRILIACVSLALMLINFQKLKKIFNLVFSMIYVLAIVTLFSQRILLSFPSLGILDLLADGYSLYNIIFWIIFAISITFNILLLDFQKKEFKLTFFLIIAIFASASLLMSPVIGYRLIIYPFFYLSLLVMLLVERIKLSSRMILMTSILFLGLSLYFVNGLVYKFKLVKQITTERNAILADYQLYSDQYKDGIWLPRYPIYSIHAGDIEIGDTFHMDAFKIFHHLELNETITFYWKESY